MSIEQHWQHRGVVAISLWPLSLLFRMIVALRRLLYRGGLLRSRHFDVPLIVVGNITVGGSGKTPLVIWLTGYLRERGWRPGIVSRGYGGKAEQWPQQVTVDSDPFLVGDEAVLIAQRTGSPVCVGPDRPRAVASLLQHSDCDLVISDDGMQHYALGRDLEIAVVDGERRFGNGWMLPAGPLREPVSRMRTVDLVVSNGDPRNGEYAMQLQRPLLRSLNPEGTARDIAEFKGQRVRAIAGIGNPQRFFDMLKRHGLLVESHPFPDHHVFQASDFDFGDELPLLMTEKDAVKCARTFKGEAWVVSIDALPDAAFVHRLNLALNTLNEDRHG